jgi:hypothetical protein
MIRHETTMKTSQMFSHFQRGMIFMGAVNSPLQAPESNASSIPGVTLLLPLSPPTAAIYSR